MEVVGGGPDWRKEITRSMPLKGLLTKAWPVPMSPNPCLMGSEEFSLLLTSASITFFQACGPTGPTG